MASAHGAVSSILSASKTTTIIIPPNKHGKCKGGNLVHIKREKKNE